MNCPHRPSKPSDAVCAACLADRLSLLITSPSPPSPPSSPSPAIIDNSGDEQRTPKFKLSNLFHHPKTTSNSIDPSPRSSKSTHHSNSWLSALFSNRRRKKNEVSNRDNNDNGVLSAPESGYVSESTAGGRGLMKKKPKTPPATARSSAAEHRHKQLGRGLSGLAVCLSPMARGVAHRSKMGAAFSGEEASPRQRSEVGGGPALRPNRSRKLADFGKLR